jgi:hypothetical protein
MCAVIYWITRRDRNKGRAASQKMKFVSSSSFVFIFSFVIERVWLLRVFIFLCPSSRFIKGRKKKTEFDIRRVMDTMKFLEWAETIPICCHTTPCPIIIKRSGWQTFQLPSTVYTAGSAVRFQSQNKKGNRLYILFDPFESSKEILIFKKINRKLKMVNIFVSFSFSSFTQ